MNRTFAVRCAVTILAVLVFSRRLRGGGLYLRESSRATDFVFSASGILYITDGADIDRFNTKTDTYLAPFVVGGNLLGIDLSPDGNTLAVADSSYQGSTNHIQLVNTSTGAATAVNFPLAGGESGTYDVAWESNGDVLVTSNYAGSGSVPLRQYNPQTGQTTILRQVLQSTWLAPSADRKTVGLAESNISSGPLDVFSVASGGIVSTVDTGWFTFDDAVSPNGNTFIVPTYYGAIRLQPFWNHPDTNDGPGPIRLARAVGCGLRSGFGHAFHRGIWSIGRNSRRDGLQHRHLAANRDARQLRFSLERKSRHGARHHGDFTRRSLARGLRVGRRQALRH